MRAHTHACEKKYPPPKTTTTTTTKMCSVRALINMFQAIGTSGSESQAFPIRGSHFNRRLRALTAAGAGEIIPTSFRKGWATLAVSCAVPGEIVKAMGDWRSTAYSCYVNQMPQKVTDHYRNLFARKLPYTMRTWSMVRECQCDCQIWTECAKARGLETARV